MRVALCGAGGTGKTTLAKEINKRFGIPLVKEFAREISEEMGINIRSIPQDKIYEFQCRILSRKIAEEDKHPTFISDRSAADNMAYYLQLCSGVTSDDKNRDYINRCLHRLRMYDYVVVIPPIIPLENDGFRLEQCVYRQYEIHCLLLGILMDNGIGWTIINESDLEKRVSIIRSFFENKIDIRHTNPTETRA